MVSLLPTTASSHGCSTCVGASPLLVLDIRSSRIGVSVSPRHLEEIERRIAMHLELRDRVTRILEAADGPRAEDLLDI
jgi:hypothetical protein